MTPSYFDYWGKADPIVGGYHLLAFHSLDVAAVAEGLLANDVSMCARLGAWLGIAPDAVPSTIATFVALHDIGKFDARFQAKAPDAAHALRSSWLGLQKPFGKGYDHGAAGFSHICRDAPDLLEQELGATARPLLQAVTGHHGDLPSRAKAEGAARWKEQRLRSLAEADMEARRQWLIDIVSLFRKRGAALPILVDPNSASVILLAGLCSVVDWIGSSVDFFPYCAEPARLETYYEQHARPRAKEAIAVLGLRGARPSGRTFVELFPDYEPRDVQRVTEDLALPDGPCLIIVEAQMGSGKTEAALSLAEKFLARGDASGLYVALPTMATSNAMFERFERDVPKMFAGEASLVLAHGRRQLHRGFQRIVARNKPTAVPYEDEATVVCHRWLTGRKRALLGQVGVGTIDQAMLAALRVHHHFVRAYALAGSVVVLDEVHAYDAYMEVILDRLIEWLGALGSPVILLSATLPESKRRLLVEAYARGAGFVAPAAQDRNPASAPYPLVTLAGPAGVHETTTDLPETTRRIGFEILQAAEPESLVLRRLADATRKGAMVAWIRNTVTDAQRAWETARGLDVGTLLLFHARMRACDRAEVENRVLRSYGKTGERRGALLIATQVVEQSLDLDFDLLVSDIAPVDLVLQRAGRLHRHPRAHRAPGCEAPRLIVVAPEAHEAMKLDFGGSGYVYDRATLGLSLGLLSERSTISVPGDIRPLVEALYDPPSRAARITSAGNCEALQAAEAKGREKLGKRQQNAKRACIAPASFDPVAAEAYYGDDDEAVQTLTRDGDSTTLFPVLWDGETGQPLEGGEPWRLDPESPSAWGEARALLEQLVSVPAYPWEVIERGARPRGEVREWEEWEARASAFVKATGLGEPVVVPMRPAPGEMWRGTVSTLQGKTLRLAYSATKGLWFRRGDET